VKRQLAIALLALIGATSAAFADTPYAGGKTDEMAPTGVTRPDAQTIYDPAPEPGTVPPSSFGLTNAPSGIYNFNP
jgi:hypothetical protein